MNKNEDSLDKMICGMNVLDSNQIAKRLCEVRGQKQENLAVSVVVFMKTKLQIRF